jgi:hypothetical protein
MVARSTPRPVIELAPTDTWLAESSPDLRFASSANPFYSVAVATSLRVGSAEPLVLLSDYLELSRGLMKSTEGDDSASSLRDWVFFCCLTPALKRWAILHCASGARWWRGRLRVASIDFRLCSNDSPLCYRAGSEPDVGGGE